MGKHPQNRLTAAMVRQLRPGMYADGNGLYLCVDESGARRWAWRGTVHGRRRELGIGPAALYSLAEARETARRWKRTARECIDPLADRDRDRRQLFTTEEAARRVHADQVLPTARNDKAAAQWITSLETYAFPRIGRTPVHAVKQRDILEVLAPIWLEKPETARRVRQRLRTIFDWSITAGHREESNPVHAIEQGLPKQRDKSRHHPALPWAE